MKRLILIISILLLVGGAGAALGDTPIKPKPKGIASSKPVPVKIWEAWRPPLVLNPGDLVRLGSTPERCAVIQSRVYEELPSVIPTETPTYTIAKTPVIGVFCLATDEKGSFIQGGHVNLFEAYGKVVAPGFGKLLDGQRFSPTESYFGPGSADFPNVYESPQLTKDQKRGKLTAIIGNGGRFKVGKTPIFCDFFEKNPKEGASVNCYGGAFYDLVFGEPWNATACDAVIFHSSAAHPDFVRWRPSWETGTCST